MEADIGTPLLPQVYGATQIAQDRGVWAFTVANAMYIYGLSAHG